MAVQHTQAVQQLSSAARRTESCPSVIGPISLEVKQMGARSAGNPHAACDVEGAGNAARLGCPALPARQPSTLPGPKPPVDWNDLKHHSAVKKLPRRQLFVLNRILP